VSNRFHYIIAGAGCAGLSLLTRLLQTNQFNDKKILLIDKAPKTTNDRTWCFWEKEAGYFEPVVYSSWDQLWFHSAGHSALYNISPYRYKMIRGEDFYKHCFNIIGKYSNVTTRYGNVDSIKNTQQGAVLETNGETLYADYIFNSIIFHQPQLSKKQFYLLQHFKGWEIETNQPAFDPAQATLMDFRMPQNHGTTFVYVMPFSATRALVEYTLISEALLKNEDYDAGLKDYLHRFLNLRQYTVRHEEFGSIPMTNYPFRGAEGSIVHIGTAGGQTRPSSGYTFQFIQKQSARLVNSLLKKGIPLTVKGFSQKRAHWYDGTLLRILSNRSLPGDEIFSTLFRKNKANDILQFLDNETSLLHELRIISVLPKRVFVKAALQQVFAQ
jgi:lycopene beta-cyclase